MQFLETSVSCTIELTTFFPGFKLLLLFLGRLKHVFIFGGFNIDTIKDSADKILNESLLLTYNFRRQNSEPTQVTPTSSTCLDHNITSYQTVHQTEKNTTSGHYTVLGETSDVKIEVTATSHSKI